MSSVAEPDLRDDPHNNPFDSSEYHHLSHSKNSSSNSKEFMSEDLGSWRRKRPIRKAKFVSRKETMFRFMQEVEKINNRLTEMKQKHKKKVMMKAKKTATENHGQKSKMVTFLELYESLIRTKKTGNYDLEFMKIMAP